MNDATSTPFWLAPLLGAAIGLFVLVLGQQLRRLLRAGQANFGPQAQRQLSELFLEIAPARLWRAQLTLSLSLAGLVLLLSRSPLLGLLTVLATWLLPRLLLARLRRQRQQRYDQQLPDALLALASALRAGVGLSSALRQVVAQAPAPLGQEFSLVLRQQRLGLTLDQALAELHQRLPSDTNALVVAALRIALETGGNLAEALERIAATLRARLHLEGRIDALTSQGRLQAWVAGSLPFTLLAMLYGLEPEAVAALWRTPAGWGVMGIVLLLEATGVWMIRRIVHIRV